MAASKAQKLMDEHEPLVTSLYTKGTAAEQAIRGKNLYLVSWEDNGQIEKWVEKLTEAYGFPTASTKQQQRSNGWSQATRQHTQTDEVLATSHNKLDKFLIRGALSNGKTH
jgi:hypothetical protein